MHLEDTFIQSNLHCILAKMYIRSVHQFPGSLNNEPGVNWKRHHTHQTHITFSKKQFLISV